MNHKRRIPLSLLTAALMLLSAAAAPAQYAGAEAVSKRMEAGFDSITPASCKTWLSKLASDEFEGRATGTPGYTRAAEYMAARFKEFGLRPKGDKGTWFQGVPFTGQRIAADRSFLEQTGTKLRLACGKDVTFRPASAVREGPVAFVSANGAGAVLANPKEVRGKVIIVRGLDNANRRLYRQLAYRTTGMLRVVDQLSPPTWRATRARRSSSRVIGEITDKAARDLAASLGVADAFDQALKDDEVVVAHADKSSVRMTVELETRPQPVPNVVGFIEGSDPDLKHEVVIMGSHLDHLGKSGGKIYNGADDDGSGSTGLLAVARAFATNPVKPRRSLLFLAFCGEEIGLVGSRYYVENPIIPIKDSVCELQMDMIGRNEEKRRTGERPEDNLQTTHLVGSKRLSMDLHDVVIAANRHVGLTFEYDEEGVYGRSDHANFARKGIPIAFFFSGFHPDYHQATDTVEKINFEKLANTAKLVYLTAFTVADREQRLAMNEKK